MEYSEFLESKRIMDQDTGIATVPPLNPMLFDFQSDIVSWALRRGRACVFADCGMGKTPMQLEWARHVPGRVLIVAPLAVSQQTVREGEKFGVKVVRSDDGSFCDDGDMITITNYERLHHFHTEDYNGIVLDESSIIKSYNGKFRNELIDTWCSVPFRLACTATPAPNDFMELGNHAEFMGVMTRTEMLSMFFIHDGGETQKWRLKGHAESEFWKWICSWAVMIRKPSDLGYEDGDFILPELRIHEVVVPVDEADSADGLLFRMPASSLQERQRERKLTTEKRARAAAQLADDDAWVFWCNLNSESKAIKDMTDAVEVEGSDNPEHKESSLLGFCAGDIKRLVTKPKIAGHGLNMQRCHKMAFVGLSDSYEQFYQAVRRCWRFGQTEPVDCYIITAETEGAVVANIKRKEKDAQKMADEMVKHMHVYNEENIRGTSRDKGAYVEDDAEGSGWTAMLGDSCTRIKEIDTDSIGYTIFSPPFSSLYTYSNSDRDMGNCKGDDEFMQHFGEYLVPELLRVTMPGRLLSFHCMNLPTSKERDGYIGIRDFRGELIRMFCEAGWIYHSEVTIWKDPLIAATRTKALGLMHKQICKDSAMCRQGIADYLVTVRKPGENPRPLEHPNGLNDKECDQRSNKESHIRWRNLASPVWMDIDATRTLQYQHARSEKDERHICPLQLDVIERGLELWSLPGDTVFSPFMGIGSEGYCSIKAGRQFIGCELKPSYWQVACRNLERANTETGELF